MGQQDELEILQKFIEEKILDTSEVAIEPDTPLLELGILNSLTTTRLVGFIRDQFGVEIPMSEMVGDNFKDLASISRLVRECDRGGR
ncbi:MULTISPECIES: acyl carrier protein [Actinoallomurus]|uniref:acyl carrier protein n=1 Tax=Actinoallomurus TaxID=667113 RepID=UPI002092001D|nr:MULTISPECIES: acyl carrier protein [Actinoallomurus]MCO5967365.1 acyl carrier protein [Actinoallomurus soli]MCO5997398.1 acyl carrier protein [Actinoallomurus rhizosphaericola]